MKKIFVLATLLFAAATTLATAAHLYNDERPIKFEELPAEAQQFVKEHFAEEKISHVIEDKELMGSEYKVVFMSGTKVEFNNAGTWKEVDSRYSAVPAQLVPKAVANYVKGHYPESSIIELKREHGGCEAKLTGGLELTFNSAGKLIEIDD